MKFNFYGISKLIPFLKPYKKRMILMIVCGILPSFIDSIYPLFSKYALDHFITQNTLDTFKSFVILYVGLLIVQVLLNFVAFDICGKLELNVNRDLRNAAFNHLQTLSFSYFNQNNVGYIHARVMSDTGKIGGMVSWDLMSLVWEGSYLIFMLINMFLVDARLALWIVLIVPIAVYFILFFQKKLVVLNRKVREMNSKITSNFNEGITGVKAIKTMVIEDKMNADFDIDSEKMEKVSIQTTRYSALFSSLVTMMSSVALSLVLWRGGLLSMQGVLLIGTLSVFLNYAINMLEPIQEIISMISLFISIQVNIERLVNLLEEKSDVVDSKEVIEKYGDSFYPKKENWEPLYGDIEFKDVSFKYPDGNEWVLEHFNLKVKQGTNVAIVGETGAGKSTLVNLICRFFEPVKGEILMDGKDIRDRSQLWLHSNIGYVLQTPHLFSGTIRENLSFGNENASDEEIYRALEMVDALDVIEKLNQGLDAQVGEGGDLLSTGQKQLLSFARAILANPRILILDEATASVDTLTEKVIQDAIYKVIQGRTSFVIAHRLSTIVDADIILVVKDGKIIERGKHMELMRQKGYYFELYSRQFEQMATDLVI